MSSNIEDNIVSMKFDNKQFESGVATSLGTMDKLKSSLAFPDAGKGLADVNKAAQGFNLNPMATSIQGISKLWLGMTTVAITAISNVTNKAVDAGLRLAKSFTIDPITAGFKEYETNLNSVQTIMANTGENVGTVNKYLNELNHYSDKTIYNFSQMARNIGTFTAAGVDLKTSTAAIKGIANLAAVSGSNADQASTAMYQLSQALASGKVGLQDWNSVVNAGMGGKVFQQALVRTGQNMGAIGKGAISLEGPMKNLKINGASFRESIMAAPGQESWLTSDVLTQTLKQLSGNMTDAQLKAQGYTKAQREAILSMADTASQAATRVKTFSQLIDVIREAVGSGWAKIFGDLFGNFKEASTLWTGVSNTITGAISNIFGAVDNMLVGWRKLGGYKDLWTAIGNIFKVIGNLLHPIVVLFQAIFPSAGKAGAGLAKFTHFLAVFTGWLVKATDGVGNFSPNMEAVGKTFHVVSGIIGAFVKALQPLLPLLGQLGDYVGDLFNQGMDIAGNLIAGWTAGLDPAALKTAAADLANSWVTWIKNALGIHSPATTMIPIGLNIIQGIVEGLNKGAQFMIQGLQKIFLGLGQAIKWMVANISWSDVLDTINTGLFLGLVLLFRRFVKAFEGTIGQFQEIMGKAGGVLDQVTNNLKTMQSKVKSEIIRNIAISVALLAASALLLSTIDTKKLGIALGAIGGLMAGLVASMKVVAGGKGTDAMSAKQIGKRSGMLIALGTAMIEFSTAIMIMVGAVALMGQLDPKTIEKGLAGVAGVIAIITTATAILSKTGGGATIMATATAMLIMSAALVAFVGVMKLYEKLDWKTLVRGGGSAAAVILAVGLAMRGFGKGAIAGSVGLIIAAGALLIMAKAMQQLAAIGLGDMIKSVVALGFILAIVVGAAEGMQAAEGGALSMLVMAGALIVLAKALQILSKIPLLDLAKAIGAITLAIIIIAATSAALSELSPLVAALGTALLLIGGALFLAGAGVFLFASGMALLAVVGPAAFQSIHDGIDQLLEVLPKIGEALGMMVVSFLTGMVKAAGPLAKALGKLIEIILQALKDAVPKVGDLIQKLVKVILRVIVNNQINAAKAMIRFVVGMLRAMADGIPKMIKAGADLIIGVIKGLSKNGVKIANATGQAILDFLKGLDKAIVKYEPRIIRVGIQIGKDLIAGAVQGFQDAAPDFMGKVEDFAHSALDKLKKPWEILSPSKATRKLANYFGQGAVLGIQDQHKNVEKSAEEMANKAMDALKMTFGKSRNAALGLENLSPKVTPVLDLTQLEKDATAISAKMGSHSVKADLSRNQARDIAAHHAAHHGSGGPESGGDTYEFIQNNYSPKPINHVKAYRGTHSQIALFKEVTRK